MIQIRHYEKLLLAAALGALLGVGGWAQRNPPRAESARRRLRPAETHSVANVGGALPAEIPTWNDPPPQTRGGKWVYEMFTPPEIYYDPRSREFTVTPPLAPVSENIALPTDEPPATRPTPFRLQLVGFVGGDGNYLGTFENLATSEHLLARRGRVLPELEVTIRDFQVSRVRREPDDSMATTDFVATAVVHDDRTGEDVVLTNLEPAYAHP